MCFAKGVPVRRPARVGWESPPPLMAPPPGEEPGRAGRTGRVARSELAYAHYTQKWYLFGLCAVQRILGLRSRLPRKSPFFSKHIKKVSVLCRWIKSRGPNIFFQKGGYFGPRKSYIFLVVFFCCRNHDFFSPKKGTFLKQMCAPRLWK